MVAKVGADDQKFEPFPGHQDTQVSHPLRQATKFRGTDRAEAVRDSPSQGQVELMPPPGPRGQRASRTPAAPGLRDARGQVARSQAKWKSVSKG